MPATQKELFERLTELDIHTITVNHIPIFTVKDGEEVLKDIPGGHCKSLFLKDKKGVFWLVVMLGDTRLDINALQKKIGSGRLSFAKPNLMHSVLGVEPGSVTPFALINPSTNCVNVLLQGRMMEKEILNYHPLENSATTTISSEGLLKFIKAMGHNPLILDF